MPTYVTLANFTDQGVRNYADTPKRAQAFKDLVEQMGGTLKDIYWTMGAFDIVAITEAPDDETATAAALKVASLGNVRTTTMRGFDMDEVTAIVASAG
ncbi:MAG TPA: GYD domain-containing protein [Acidimicrobiia bacterium]|nr:GYD domain-containing protein [Acidimicrobiia bacterium]